VIQTDASDWSIAGVYLQEEETGLHPVMYVSRKLLPREKMYPIGEREMLAIVFTIERLFKYVCASKFTVQTDCEALAYLRSKPSNNARIVRWQLYLQSFDYRVEAISGSQNGLADYLSRLNMDDMVNA
jgi:hypothetical protein